MSLNPDSSSPFPSHNDNPPTTPHELSAWYTYPIAAEVYAVVGVGAFLPVLLEQLARENGVWSGEAGVRCVSRGEGSGEQSSEKGSEQCVVTLLGKTMSTSSFAMYTFAMAVCVQGVLLVVGSGVADYGPHRKTLLLTFSYLGALSSALLIFVTPSVYYLAPILVITGVASLGCSFVLLNAFLPLLVANHPDRDNSSDTSSAYELEALVTDNTDGPKITWPNANDLSRDLELSAHISSRGVGYGYMSAVFVQVVSIGILWLFSGTDVQKRDPSLPIRVILLLVGVWWAVLSTPTLLWLRPRPGPPLPVQERKDFRSAPSRLRTGLFYISFSLRSFWNTLRRAVRLRQTLRFLVSWFLLSDSVATISGTAVLFARTELHMGTIAIALLSITSIGSGVVGAFAWPRIQKYFSLQPKSVLLCCIAGMEIIPLYGLLGFLPLFKKLGFIGLQQPWEIYPIAVLHGMVMGGISSYARSVFAPLIPEGSEAAFFALYAVTDKGSSAVGPALVGWIVDHMGSIRPAFVFLAVLVVLPAPLLWWLDVEKGREDARTMAEADGKARGVYERIGEE